MQFRTTAVVLIAATQGVSATFGCNSWWCVPASNNWLDTLKCALPWNKGLAACKSPAPAPTPSPPKCPWPPAPPVSSCPPKWPWPQVPWKHPSGYPGNCPKPPKDDGPKYPPGCTPNPPKNTNFTLGCPDKPAGQIFDGQIQCNSPYPGQEVADGIKSFITSTFYIKDGSLYDQLGRACEISAGNQLQCNVLPSGATAMKGFAIDSKSDLIWQGENTWYGCNIGTEDKYGTIIFTGTHKEFSGNSAPTENPNCDAYRLSVIFTK